MTTVDGKQLLNRLVLCDQSRGRIKYVGPIYGVNNDAETWYGIDWVDLSRGKHDGSYKGRQYFKTKHPTSGSFVKPAKVDLGVDIWSAIESKYFSKDEFLNSGDQNQDQLLYNNFNIHEKAIDLERIGLARCRISTVENCEKILNTFPSLVELDLEENLLGTWSQVFTILGIIKHMRVLNVSNNSIEFDDINESSHFENLNSLIINRMGYTWKDVMKIVEWFPKLRELKVCFNSIKEITILNKNLLENLRILDVESNPINDWKSILKLGELTNLEILNANDTGISDIYFEDGENTSLFPRLRSLFLNQNRINNWQSINELNKLKCLDEVRMRQNPLNDSDKVENIRQLVIARVSSLKMFNRTPVTSEERKGAEIDYLKKFGKKWLAYSAKKEDNFPKEHPRYFKLIELYGAPEKGEIDVKPDILKTSLISLRIKNGETGEIVQRKIPSSIEIKRLKAMICNLFKTSSFDSESMSLFYESATSAQTSYELDNDYRTLSFYSIENGNILIAKKA